MARGKPEIDGRACNGCGQCVEVCPQDIVRLYRRRSASKVRCIDEQICTACGKCARACPRHAIRIFSFSITAGG